MLTMIAALALLVAGKITGMVFVVLLVCALLDV